MSISSFEKLIFSIDDMLANLFYYDRKEDEDFTLKNAEEPLTEEQKDIFCAEIRKRI